MLLLILFPPTKTENKTLNISNMKTVTVLVPLNFDVENGNLEEVQNIIDNINGLLSRNTYDCNDAQILSSGLNEADITINNYDEEED